MFFVIDFYSVGSFDEKYRRQRYTIHDRRSFDESFHVRPSFSFRSLLSRTRRNLLINKTKLRFFRCLCVASLFSAHSFLSVETFASAVGSWSTSSSSALTSPATVTPLPPPSPPSRGISTLILRLWRVSFTRRFLPLLLPRLNVILGRWSSFCAPRDLI